MIGDVATGSARDLPLGDGTMESDDALALLAQDDPAAFAALYVRYVDLVYRFCYRRLGDRAAAEDATSRIFERALRALPRYRAGSFRSWLFTIAYNTIADLHRSGRRMHRIPPDWDAPDSQPGPEAQAVDADEGRWIRGLLAHLTDDQRRVIELRLAGLTDAEIAAVLGRTRGSVRTIQYRAIRKLRTVLPPEAGDEQQPGVGHRGRN